MAILFFRCYFKIKVFTERRTDDFNLKYKEFIHPALNLTAKEGHNSAVLVIFH